MLHITRRASATAPRPGGKGKPTDANRKVVVDVSGGSGRHSTMEDDDEASTIVRKLPREAPPLPSRKSKQQRSRASELPSFSSPRRAKREKSDPPATPHHQHKKTSLLKRLPTALYRRRFSHHGSSTPLHSAKTQSLADSDHDRQQEGRTAFIAEMPRSSSVACHARRSEASRRSLGRTHQIQPMGSGGLLRFATRDAATENRNKILVLLSTEGARPPTPSPRRQAKPPEGREARAGGDGERESTLKTRREGKVP